MCLNHSLLSSRNVFKYQYIMNKSINIRVESEEELTMIKALMLSLDISFKIEEEYTNECKLNNKGSNVKSTNISQ